jgi:hypothetical protein
VEVGASVNHIGYQGIGVTYNFFPAILMDTKEEEEKKKRNPGG